MLRITLPFTRESCLVHAKMWSGFRAEEYCALHGWPNGWFSDSINRRLAQEICDGIEGVADYLQKNYSGPNSWGHLLARRGSFCLPEEYGGKNELVPLRRPGLKPLHDLVQKSMVENRTIHVMDRYAAQEEVVVLQVHDEIGVYLRMPVENDGTFYVGKADKQSIAKRNSGHYNSLMFLEKAWLMNTVQDVSYVEKGLHRLLQLRGAMRIRQNARTLGLWRLPRPLNPLQVVDDIMNTAYRDFFYGVATVATGYGLGLELIREPTLFDMG